MNDIATLAGRGIHLAANLSLLYQDLPFLQRFDACARDGFRGVEILFPYDLPAAEISSALQANGLQLVLINAPPGNLAAGDRGLLGQPGREAEFRGALALALRTAQATGCKRIHLMMGIAADGRSPQTELAARRALVLANLRFAAHELEGAGITGLLEPINTRDIPGYLLNTLQQACDLLDEVDSPWLALQMDLYHCAIAEGDVATRIRRHLDRVGHIQIAGVPDRHEPFPSELDHGYLFGVLEQLGYKGWVGCEYRPADTSAGGTSRGLEWMRHLRARA